MCNFRYLSYARSRETAFSVDAVGRRRSACVCESRKKQRLFIGATEAKFPYFSKGKPVSSWLISKSSDIFLYKSSFCTSNSWRFVLFSLRRASAFITNLRRLSGIYTFAWLHFASLRWLRADLPKRTRLLYLLRSPLYYSLKRQGRRGVIVL